MIVSVGVSEVPAGKPLAVKVSDTLTLAELPAPQANPLVEAVPPE